MSAIFLNISEIASFVGQNKWDNITPFEKLWKKYDKEYEICLIELSNQISNKNVDLITISNESRILTENLEKGVITKRQFSKSIKENNDKKLKVETTILQITEKFEHISLTQTEKIEKELGSIITNTIYSEFTDTDDKRKITNEAIDKLVKTGKIKDEQKQELLKQTQSLINKTHGTLKEDLAIQIFEKQNNIKLDTTQKYYKYMLTKTNDYTWYIGGKMDGLYIDFENKENNYVVEVKNRVKGFFTSIRDYELTQIQLYLLLTGYSKAKLVEKYNTKIRITDIKSQDDYINDTLEYLKIFINNFIKFLSNFKLKMEYISLNECDKNKFLEKLYLKEIIKLRKEKAELLVIQLQTQEDCLLDDLDDF
jgi:hypothetical protein